MSSYEEFLPRVERARARGDSILELLQHPMVKSVEPGEG